MAMVVRANQERPGISAHLTSNASIASIPNVDSTRASLNPLAPNLLGDRVVRTEVLSATAIGICIDS